MTKRRRGRWLLACLIAALALAGCSGGNDDEGGASSQAASDATNTEETAQSAELSAEPAASQTSGQEVPADDGAPRCGEELLRELPPAIPFPADAEFASVCEDANDYGSGIAIRYRTGQTGEQLTKLYGDALKGEYEVSQFDVPGVISMQFMRGEEAITMEIDTSAADHLSVNMAYGLYEGGFDDALGDALEEISEGR